MQTRTLLLLTTSLVAAASVAFGCASESRETASSTSSDISGTMAQAQACAVHAAYLAADLKDFTPQLPGDLPFRWSVASPPNPSEVIIERFSVEGIGYVYYIETTNDGVYFDFHGRELLTTDGEGKFYYPGSLGILQDLSCPDDASPRIDAGPDASPAWPDAGDAG
jgi:hypothetical protein